MLGRKVIFVRCINCSYNNVAKGIRLLDKKAFFIYTGKFHASKSVRKIHIPLILLLICIFLNIIENIKTKRKIKE